jgi:hypothetical protein
MVKYSVLLTYTYLIAVTQIFIQTHPAAAASKTTVAAGRSLWPTGILVHLCTLLGTDSFVKDLRHAAFRVQVARC